MATSPGAEDHQYLFGFWLKMGSPGFVGVGRIDRWKYGCLFVGMGKDSIPQ
jgi:hypothetical protein